jgi:Flp pilus assembly protein TadD
MTRIDNSNWTRPLSIIALAMVVAASGCSGTGGKKATVHSNSALPNLDGGTTADLDDNQMADVLYAQGRMSESQGELPRAIECYQEAISLDPKRGDVALRLGMAYDQMGQFENGKPMYEKALKLDPGNPQVFCAMGYSQYLQGDFISAERNLRQALAVKKDYQPAHNNLAFLLARTGRTKDALREFHYGGCSEAESYNNVALACMLDQRLEDARHHYQLALEVDRTNASAIEGLKKVDIVVAALDRAQRPVGASGGMLASHQSTPPTRPASAPATRQAQAPATGAVAAMPVRTKPTPAVPVAASQSSSAPLTADNGDSEQARVRRVPAVTMLPSEGVVRTSQQVFVNDDVEEPTATECESCQLELSPGAMQGDRLGR